MSIENVAKNQGKLGSLRPFQRCRKEFFCDDCQEKQEIGSPGYTQSDYRGDSFYPSKRRICKRCGDDRIANGEKVKEKNPKKKQNGYPKENQDIKKEGAQND